jgi:hypothetical protein
MAGKADDNKSAIHAVGAFKTWMPHLARRRAEPVIGPRFCANPLALLRGRDERERQEAKGEAET